MASVQAFPVRLSGESFDQASADAAVEANREAASARGLELRLIPINPLADGRARFMVIPYCTRHHISVWEHSACEGCLREGTRDGLG
jgi:hypothetical protein